jgi:RNA-directed DNA polymerase
MRGEDLRGAKICWSEKTLIRFRREVRRLTNRNRGVSMSRRLTELDRYLRPIPEIDQWIRRRVRMCYWIQWRRARTRIGNLLKMGVSKDHAILTGRSSRGPWHLARTEATKLAMSNKWLEQQGLVSVKDLWVSFNYPW